MADTYIGGTCVVPKDWPIEAREDILAFVHATNNTIIYVHENYEHTGPQEHLDDLDDAFHHLNEEEREMALGNKAFINDMLDGDTMHFDYAEFDTDKDGNKLDLTFGGTENFRVNELCAIVEAVAKKHGIAYPEYPRATVEYAVYCSSPRIGEFNGGKVYVDANGQHANDYELHICNPSSAVRKFKGVLLLSDSATSTLKAGLETLIASQVFGAGLAGKLVYNRKSLSKELLLWIENVTDTIARLAKAGQFVWQPPSPPASLPQSVFLEWEELTDASGDSYMADLLRKLVRACNGASERKARNIKLKYVSYPVNTDHRDFRTQEYLSGSFSEKLVDLCK